MGTPAASHGESLGESLGKSLGESLGESLGKSLGESHARMDMNWTQWRRTCCRNTHQMRPSQRIAAHHRASQRITGHHSASQGIPTHHNESHDIITHHNKSVKGDLRGVHLAACGRMFPLLSRGNWPHICIRHTHGQQPTIVPSQSPIWTRHHSVSQGITGHHMTRQPAAAAGHTGKQARERENPQIQGET